MSVDLKAQLLEDVLTVVGRLFQALGPTWAKSLFPNSLLGRIKESLPESTERSRERDVRDESYCCNVARRDAVQSFEFS